MLVAIALVGIAATGTLQSLTLLNRNAASIRLLTNAREVVLRNIDSALSVPWSNDYLPAILAVTPTEGVVYEDDLALDQTVVIASQSGNKELVRGVLRRSVQDVPNGVNAQVRKITFRIDYVYRSRPFSYALTTMRAIDD